MLKVKINYEDLESLKTFIRGKTLKSAKVHKVYGEGAIVLLKALFTKLPKKIKVEDFYKNTLREGKKSIRLKNHLSWCNTYLKKHGKGFILEPIRKEGDEVLEVKVKPIK